MQVNMCVAVADSGHQNLRVVAEDKNKCTDHSSLVEKKGWDKPPQNTKYSLKYKLLTFQLLFSNLPYSNKSFKRYLSFFL